MGRSMKPGGRDGNAVLALAVVAATSAVVGFVLLWAWRAHTTGFWVLAAVVVVGWIGFSAAETWMELREGEREAREKRAVRTQQRFLRHLHDRPGEPSGASGAAGGEGEKT